MHGTKTNILALLKRSDGATVDDLAGSLGLASMTVRQHLMALERDSLIRSEEVRRATGRPHFVYRLTGEGHRSIAQGYDRLLALIVAEAGQLNGSSSDSAESRRVRLFTAAALSLASRHRTELQELGAAERIERAAAILRSHGGFAEWHDLGGGSVEFRDFSCVFRESVSTHGPCAWHETFLTEVLMTELSAPPEPARCAACCRYVIAIGAAVGGASSR